MKIEDIGPQIAAIAIAVEHFVFRALDYNLGICWVRLIDEKKIRETCGCDEKYLLCSFFIYWFSCRVYYSSKKAKN